MTRRMDEYMRAVENGTTGKYHDRQDVVKGRMPRAAYQKKHGGAIGVKAVGKHV